jgi:hypothetical protein
MNVVILGFLSGGALEVRFESVQRAWVSEVDLCLPFLDG